MKAKADDLTPAAQARPAGDARQAPGGLQRRLAEARAQQAAISEILRLIADSPNDVQPVLDATARLAADLCEIAVIDTGVGIAPDEQALVFDEFRQARGEHLAKAEGTGLGLALVKRFVELHGGRVGVESAPGCGSTFAFILPRRPAESPR